MKALAAFPSSREVRLVDHPEPVITGPTDVKLRILEAGVCGTDREITSFEYGDAAGRLSLLGHRSRGSRRSGRSRERCHRPGARRPRGADGAPPLRGRLVRPLPSRSPGLLHHRRFHRAGHQRECTAT